VENTYKQISPKEAKQIMDDSDGYIILDVRTQSEYDQGHIPNAVLLPNETIGTDEIEILPDKNQLILVYCRSGNRSKQASQKLVDLGYTNIYEFGGIIDWPYDIVTD
jgi:rhodanese-related sulfurtransferase